MNVWEPQFFLVKNIFDAKMLLMNVDPQFLTQIFLTNNLLKFGNSWGSILVGQICISCFMLILIRKPPFSLFTLFQAFCNVWFFAYTMY